MNTDYQTEKWFKRELAKEKHARIRAKRRRQRQNFQAKKRGNGKNVDLQQITLGRIMRIMAAMVGKK